MSEDINNEILKELKRSRRFNQTVMVVIGVVVILNLVFHTRPAEPTLSWSAPQSAIRQLDYARAVSLVKANIAHQPNDYYGYQYLGIIYLAMGDLTNSETQFSRSYALFPSEENEKYLAAVRKRMSSEAGFKMLSK